MSFFTQPCKQIDADVVLQSGLHSIAQCKQAFMSQEPDKQTLAWYDVDGCHIGKSTIDSEWIETNCGMQNTTMPEWSLMVDKVKSP